VAGMVLVTGTMIVIITSLLVQGRAFGMMVVGIGFLFLHVIVIKGLLY
jgi:hypothetical protein